MHLRSHWRSLFNKWLRRGPPRYYQGPEVVGIVSQLEEIAGRETTWPTTPPLGETYYYLPTSQPLANAPVQAAEVRSGTFRVSPRFASHALGFPPDWKADPLDDDNWLSNLHGLEWTIPLLQAHQGEPEAGHLTAWKQIVEDWIHRNPFRGAPSRFSWHDHASSKRLRLFAWMWEQYRRDPGYDSAFARILLASVYQHALYHLDPRNYRPDSNHGLESIGALWAAALTFPSFTEAPYWETIAYQRVHQWINDNLSSEGFHLEQSPSYHWFVLLRLAALDRFLRVNGKEVAALAQATERAACVWPHLLQPNGHIPGVGDSSRTAPTDWSRFLRTRWGKSTPPPAPSSAPPVHSQTGAFLLSPRAGYAIFRSGASTPEHDTYLLFRCRAFLSPHCHYDALSFILSAFGRDWIVDPGFLTYHEWDERRQYLRSPQAHSLVIAGEGDFRTHASEVVEWSRTKEADYIVAYHDLPQGRHLRRLSFTPPLQLVIRDEFHSKRNTKLPWKQLFQIAVDLKVQEESDTRVVLVSPSGETCTISQSLAGRWEVVTAQVRPGLQGWYSPAYGKWEPGKTVIFHPAPGAEAVETILQLQPPQDKKSL